MAAESQPESRQSGRRPAGGQRADGKGARRTPPKSGKKPGSNRPRPAVSGGEAPTKAESGRSTAASDRKSKSARRPAPTPAKERKALGKYEVIRLLGAGGMGTVYLATDTDLNRTVALKVLPKERANNPILVKRFKAEALAAAQLRHDNIVTVYEAGEAEGYLYIALEYIEGTDVHELVAKRGVIPVKRSVDIVRQVARALQHAHEQSIVHRDIKPSNLLIRRDGMVKLTDLGLARSVDDSTETSITRDGTTVGTIDYMSPEQARSSKAADIRSDIYSLGCAWYHMLTGAPPFAEGSVTNKLNAHSTKPLPDPRDQNERIPEGVVAVLRRMTAKEPQDRYQTPAELLADIDNPTLLREAVSDNVLASLADSPEGAARPVPTPPSGPQALPPRSVRRDETDDEEESGIGEAIREKLRYVAIAAGLILLLGLSWWIIARVVDGLGGPGSFGEHNPFARVDPDAAVNTAGLPTETPGRDITEGDAGSSSGTGSGRRDLRAPDSGNGNGNGQQSTGTDNADPGADLPPNTRRFPRDSGDPAATTPVVVKRGNSPGGLRPRPDEGQLPDVKIGRESERAEIPRWVAALTPPADLASSVTAKMLKILTVGHASDGEFAHGSIAAALKAIPDDGAVIQLHGRGPFRLPSIEVVDTPRIVLMAGGDVRPLVLLESQHPEVSLKVRNGSLELVGLDLFADAASLPPKGDFALVEVESGDLSVRHSSITLHGTRAGPTHALRVSSPVERSAAMASARPRVLLDGVLTRGDGLTPIALTVEFVDALALNSLFASGKAPAVWLRNAKGAAAPEAGSPEKSIPRLKRIPAKGLESTGDSADRVIRLVSCTTVGQSTAFDLADVAAHGIPPATSLLTVNSVIAAAEGGAGPVLVRLADWGLAAVADREQGKYRNLTWRTEATQFSGFSTLLDFQGDSDEGINTARQWQQAWRQLVPADELTGPQWPAERIENWAAITPEALDPRSSDDFALKANDGGRIGAPPESLSVPDADLIRRVIAQRDRPRIPTTIFRPKPSSKPVEIDVGRRDLGKIITEAQWPSGTLVIVKGSGTKRMSPARIRNRSLSIRFEQQPGLPLILEARSFDQVPGLGKSDAPLGLFNVESGSLELIDANLKIPASRSRTFPRWFVKAENSSFRISRGYLDGPMLESRDFEAAISWNAVAAAGGNGKQRYAGIIEDTWCGSIGRTLDARIGSAALRIHNSARSI